MALLKFLGIALQTVLGLLLIITVFGAGYGCYRTWKTGHSQNYTRFMQGAVPRVSPGLWAGFADELGEVSWKGKKFEEGGTGINIFEENGRRTDLYPFLFFESDSLEGKGKKVLRIDYGQKENPLWLRFIVDEVVSVGDGKFLGTISIALIPGFPFRMGYFRLER